MRVIASVQTAADTAPFLPYAAAALVFVAVSAAALGTLILIDRWIVDPYLRRHLDRATDRQVIRDFSAEVDRWDAEQTARARRTR